MNEWKTIKLKMEKVSLIKTKLYRFWRWITFRPIRKLKMVYTDEMYQDLKAVHGMNAQEGLFKILQYEMDLELKKLNVVRGKDNNIDHGVFYAPYIPLQHTEESSKKYHEYMDVYYKEHECCPKCGSEGGITTLMGYPLVEGKESEFKDFNSVTCTNCGNVHTCHNRVKNIKKEK